ncbi:MAG TPA: hypothetical protein VM871_05155 [Flavisolibacter sp.]|jgi:hypothetical protein|nr:hypothetical protein [Flavisolibacter sp.]
MKIFLLFLLILAYSKTPAQIDLTDSLSKYSYLIQAKDRSSTQATGFFVRYQHRLFFITAAHCLTGWDPFRFRSIENAPDTVYIRLSNDTSKLKYMPLPLADVKKTARPFREYEAPDVCVIEIKDPKKYNVNSVEQFFEEIRCDKARTIYVFGYPRGDGYNDYFRDRQQPFASTATLREEYCVYAFRPETRVHDAVNYYTYMKDGTGPGLSGAPAYILTENKHITFGGIYIGGGDQVVRTGMVVRPEHVIRTILSSIGKR